MGIARLATAAITGAMLLSKDSKIHDECPDKQCNPAGRDAIDSTHSLFTINAIGWGVGTVGVGVATWVLLIGDDHPSTEATALTPVVVPSGAGFALDRRS